MSEATTKITKRKKKQFNNAIKDQLIAKYKIDGSTFYRCFDGSRSSDLSIKIKKEYNELNDALTKALNAASAQLVINNKK